MQPIFNEVKCSQPLMFIALKRMVAFCKKVVAGFLLGR